MKTFTAYGEIAMCDFTDDFFPEYMEATTFTDADYHKIVTHIAEGYMEIVSVKNAQYGWHTDGDDLHIQITGDDHDIDALHQRMEDAWDGLLDFQVDDGDTRIHKVP